MSPAIDYTGKRVGKLVAVRPTGEIRYQGRVWLWQCDCGGTVERVPAHLSSAQRRQAAPVKCRKCVQNRPRSGRKPVKLTGRKFGLWKVLHKASRRGEGNHSMWQCLCRGCKTMHVVRSSHLTTFHSSGCAACMRKPPASDGERLTRWRWSHGLSMQAAADRLGISKQRWCQWEQKGWIHPDDFARLTTEQKSA